MTYLHTYSGKTLSFIDPQPDDIDIKDISHHLGRICRFNGACQPFYSVAQHSIFVSDQVDAPIQLSALLHDAGEAYYGDMSTPFKEAMQECVGSRWDIILARIDNVIMMKFNLKYRWHKDIKIADRLALATEIRYLTSWNLAHMAITLPTPHGKPLRPMEPLSAIHDFYQTYLELT